MSLSLAYVPKVGWREAHVIMALRVECGWLAKDLAQRAGLNPSIIYRLEDGRVKHPTTETLEKIARAFGVTVREIRNAVPVEPMQFATALPAKTLNVTKEAKRIEREVRTRRR